MSEIILSSSKVMSKSSDPIREQSLISSVIQSLPGLSLVAAVSIVAYYLSPILRTFPLFKTYLSLKDFILAILIGIMIKNTIGISPWFQTGLNYSTVLTKTGIVIMGVKYSLSGLAQLGAQVFLYIFFFLFGTAIITMWIFKKLKLPTALGACLASGLSICGVSATIAIAPAVGAKNREMTYAIAVVLMFGLLALILFPLLGNLFQLSDAQYGAFCGVGIVNSAQVLAAGFGYSEGAGLVAGVYNIGRVILLPFVVLLLCLMACGSKVEEGSVCSPINKRQLIKDKFPVFVLGFLLMVGLNTAGCFSPKEIHQATCFMNIAFLSGFASIGLTTRLSDLTAAGWSGFFIGFLIAGTKAAVALMAVLFFLK